MFDIEFGFKEFVGQYGILMNTVKRTLFHLCWAMYMVSIFTDRPIKDLFILTIIILFIPNVGRNNVSMEQFKTARRYVLLMMLMSVFPVAVTMSAGYTLYAIILAVYLNTMYLTILLEYQLKISSLKKTFDAASKSAQQYYEDHKEEFKSGDKDD